MPKFFPNYSSYSDNDKFGWLRYGHLVNITVEILNHVLEKGGIKILVQLGQSPNSIANGLI